MTLEQFADDPGFPAAYAAAQARTAALVERPCSEGNCVELFDPATGESDAGWGPVGCACQDVPKWADMFGAAPDYTGAIPVDEWLEANRGGA